MINFVCRILFDFAKSSRFNHHQSNLFSFVWIRSCHSSKLSFVVVGSGAVVICIHISFSWARLQTAWLMQKHVPSHRQNIWFLLCLLCSCMQRLLLSHALLLSFYCNNRNSSKVSAATLCTCPWIRLVQFSRILCNASQLSVLQLEIISMPIGMRCMRIFNRKWQVCCWNLDHKPFRVHLI